MFRKLLAVVSVFLTGLILIVSSTVSAAPAVLGTFTEVEPNDSLAQAQVIGLGVTNGTNNSVADVDYYRLDLTAGQSLHLYLQPDCATSMWDQLTILDPDSNVLFDDQNISFGVVVDEFVAPSTGAYYVRVTNPEDESWEVLGNYHLFVNDNPAGEPFNSAATAIPISYGDQVNANYDWPNDNDYYRFDGHAGDILRLNITTISTSYAQVRTFIEGSEWQVNESTWTPGLTTQSVVLPETGSYVIATDVYNLGPDHSCSGQTNSPQPYVLTIDRDSLYVAGQKAGKVNGVKFGTNDILALDGNGQWQLVFDGEDVGVKAPISAFELTDNGQILMTFTKKQTIAGLGKVTPWDIVRFNPSHQGANTQGSFSWYLHGSDVGLKGAAGKIDAIALTPDQNLVISTAGNPKLAQFGGGIIIAADEDLMQFHVTGPLPSTGTWSTYMDGSAASNQLPKEDIWSATILNEENSTGAWAASILFTLNSQFVDFNGSVHTQVAKGNLVGFDRTLNELILQPTNNTLGFPRPISGLSAGPGW